jgi:peptidoglycan hydrolase-like protein with peptidoglycan-binding domain
MNGLWERRRGWALASSLILLIALLIVWLTNRGGSSSQAGATAKKSPAATAAPAPLKIVAVTPANGTKGVSGTNAISVTFSAPLDPSTRTPTVTPAVPGAWSLGSPNQLMFTPDGGLPPATTVTMTIPGGVTGVRARDGGQLATSVSDTFKVADGSVVRAQQLLSQLGYSPLSWTATEGPLPAGDAAAQARAVFDPPPGTFAWRNAGWPQSLISRWLPGSYGPMTKGMVMAFEVAHGMAPDGVLGPKVWQALLAAAVQGDLTTAGYNYAIVSKAPPQTLTIWHNGQQVFTSQVNTGISVAPTADGTFPVYLRLRNQVMRGTNPDGSHYADPVQFVAYFNGGNAVHYIPRNSYGSPQSLGCVELPLAQAATAWSYLPYGTLVTVTG